MTRFKSFSFKNAANLVTYASLHPELIAAYGIVTTFRRSVTRKIYQDYFVLEQPRSQVLTLPIFACKSYL